MTEKNDIAARLPAELINRVKSARLHDGVAKIVLDAGRLDARLRNDLERQVRDALEGADGVLEVRVALMGERVQRKIIAIGSGKGGVGKSTLTANLAIALKNAGHKVGVVDADIYGPSQPKLLAAEGITPKAKDKQLIPVEGFGGLPMLSMGQLVDDGRALAWRGPMAAGAFQQLMEGDWGEVELLLVDLPPGTGDVQLTMLQRFKPDGAVIVSTPQDLAMIDARRAIQLFAQAEVPVLGVVENMAGYACPHCGEVSDPFGHGGVEQAAQEMGLGFLGRIPLSLDLRVASDTGAPAASSEGMLSNSFSAIAEQMLSAATQDKS